MALLKSLIQRLLDSRTTPSEASHSSYPDDGTVTQFSPSATSVSSWTKVVDSTIAPSDGYVIVRGKATGESYVQITAGDNPPHMERSTFAKTTLNQYPILNLPIAKGKTFKVFAENTAEITVGLIKSIGGGYNNLVRRALSCLRPSFNFSQRSFFKVNIPTLLINADQVPVHKARQSQETARRTLWLHSQVGLSLRLAQTVRQTTHGLGLKTPQEALHTSPLQFADTKRLLSQCKKEIFLLLTSALITRTKALFCLSLLKQQNNLQTGGASC